MTIAPWTPRAEQHVSPDIGPLLAALDREQRAAALLPDGPALILAPAGSGKTTTLIARIGVLLARGVRADRIGVVTFNRAAAEELSGRIAARLAPLAPTASEVEVRTLHALARQVRIDAGPLPELVADRLPILRLARRRVMTGRRQDAPPIPAAEALDVQLSAWKIDGRQPSADAITVFEAFAAILAGRSACDFDDLVLGAVAALEQDPALRTRWQARFSHLAVDEFQDVDLAQLRLVRLLAEPDRNLTVVGDDDQTIYAWRLADVRRMLEFERDYPGARIVTLATNYRCPPTVVDASRRLIEVNTERFSKPILAVAARDGAAGPTVEAIATGGPDGPDRVAGFVAQLPAAGDATSPTSAILARTTSELVPVVLALVRRGVRHTTTVPTPLDAPPVQRLLELAAHMPPGAGAFDALRQLRRGLGWRRSDDDDTLGEEAHAALDALLGWAAGFTGLDGLLAAIDAARRRIAGLRDPRAPVELLTVHGAKGREWPTVVVLGFEVDRFPNRRALQEGTDLERALEEERRLAYVALTRARRRLVLAFDPRRPSPFLAEMGYRPTSPATTPR